MNKYDITKLPKWAQKLIVRQERAVETLEERVAEIQTENDSLRNRVNSRKSVERIAELDQRILRQVNDAMGKAITEELTGYNKPLSKITERVIGDHEAEIYNLVNTEVVAMLTADEFKAALKKALNDKLARILIARTGGEVERRVNELKANPETRAKITLAISGVIDELAIDRSGG